MTKQRASKRAPRQTRRMATGATERSRSFPCPYCRMPVIARNTGHGAYLLTHKVPGCVAHDKPTKHTQADLLSAFVSYCQPQNVFPPIEGLDKPILG